MISPSALLGLALAVGSVATAGAQASPVLRLDDVAARVVVLPEPRSNIAIDIGRGDLRLPTPHARVEGDALVVDGGLRGRIGGCGAVNWDVMSALHHKPGAPAPGQRVMIHGVGPLALDHLPTLTVHLPQTASILVRGAAFGSVGAMRSLTLVNAGCGDWRLDAVEQRLEVRSSGSGDVGAARVGMLVAALQGSGDLAVGDVDAQADVSVHGSGDVKLERVEGPLHLEVAGSGDVRVALANGPIAASVRGSGDIRIADGLASSVAVQLAGSGDFTFQGVAGALDASSAGSGNVRVSRVTGPVAKAAAGSGEILIGGR